MLDELEAFEKGKKIAGSRSRKYLMDIKKEIHQLRADILTKQKEQKSVKKAKEQAKEKAEEKKEVKVKRIKKQKLEKV